MIRVSASGSPSASGPIPVQSRMPLVWVSRWSSVILWPVIGQLRNVFADVVGKRKFPLFDEEEDRRGDELLHHRSDVEDRVRADRNVALEVGRAVSAVHDQLSVAARRRPRTRARSAWPN